MSNQILRSKTKICCTVGPASSDINTLERMFLNGMSILRINMSHASYDAVIPVISNIRKIESKYKRKIFIALDTKGPELRIKSNCPRKVNSKDILRIYKLKGGHPVEAVPVDGPAPGSDTNTAPTSPTPPLYVNLDSLSNIPVGSRISIDDSKLLLDVIKSSDASLDAVAINSHLLLNNKRIHFESSNITLPFISPEDTNDIKFALEHSVDAIFASFVQSPDDISQLRALLSDNSILVISKIETRLGVENIEGIAGASDGIMIARGDLMNDVGVECLYSTQKLLARVETGVIMATEMLQSMVSSRSPSRAEVSDVGNAVGDGCRAIMLSSETSVGKYPVECVEVGRKVAEDAEKYHGKGKGIIEREWKGNEDRKGMLELGVYFKFKG